jgi:hypothetical protein
MGFEVEPDLYDYVDVSPDCVHAAAFTCRTLVTG